MLAGVPGRVLNSDVEVLNCQGFWHAVELLVNANPHSLHLNKSPLSTDRNYSLIPASRNS